MKRTLLTALFLLFFCQTRDVDFEGKIVAAQDVHRSTLSTLAGSYAELIDTNTLLNQISE